MTVLSLGDYHCVATVGGRTVLGIGHTPTEAKLHAKWLAAENCTEDPADTDLETERSSYRRVLNDTTHWLDKAAVCYKKVSGNIQRVLN